MVNLNKFLRQNSQKRKAHEQSDEQTKKIETTGWSTKATTIENRTKQSKFTRISHKFKIQIIDKAQNRHIPDPENVMLTLTGSLRTRANDKTLYIT